MAVYRAQVAWQIDSLAPRDRMTVNPHFTVANPLPELDTIARDIAEGFNTIHPFSGELKCSVYDVHKPKPNYPEAVHTINPGTMTTQTMPRELAVCLSFYSHDNVKRKRGRMYLPLFYVGVTDPRIEATLPLPQINATADMLANIGGIDVDWCVYSRTNDAAYPVTDWWYDNEWDVVRSRGLKGSSRVKGTTSEALAATDVISLTSVSR